MIKPHNHVLALKYAPAFGPNPQWALFETPPDSTVDDYILLLKAALTASGFSEKTFNDAIIQMAHDISCNETEPELGTYTDD
jgi:hypothetical protein